MPLKGTDIVKRLPNRKGCKECGFPTCFAFAMKLASGGATPSKCPYLNPELVAELEEALSPLQRLVTIGKDENAISIGNEEVMYRHDKTFIHQPAIALLISDEESPDKVKEKVNKIKELQFDRVGILLKANLLALYFESGDPAKYEALVKEVYQNTDVGLILFSEDDKDWEVLFRARDICGDRNPLIYPITKDNIEQAIPRIKESPTPVGVRADGVEALVPLTTQLKEAGIVDLVLDPGSKNLLDGIRDQTLIRRATLRQEFRLLGYPTIVFPCFIANDGLKEVLVASAFIPKYVGIIVLSDFDSDSLYALLVARMNIYIDPRKPLAVEEKIYEIGEPNADSPVLVTTNYALTYFAASGGIEDSKVPAFLCVQDTEGLCILSAWSTSKFVGDTVGPFIKKCGIEDRVNHRRLIIPGLAARIKGELEDNLPGWEIIVGPRDAIEIPAFLPSLVEKWQS